MAYFSMKRLLLYTFWLYCSCWEPARPVTFGTDILLSCFLCLSALSFLFFLKSLNFLKNPLWRSLWLGSWKIGETNFINPSNRYDLFIILLKINLYSHDAVNDNVLLQLIDRKWMKPKTVWLKDSDFLNFYICLVDYLCILPVSRVSYVCLSC